MAQSEQDQRSYDYFKEFFRRAKRHRDDLEDSWNVWEQSFLGLPDVNVVPESTQPWRSRLFTKYGYQQIQTLTSELAADDLPNFRFEARNAGMEANSKAVQGLVDYQLDMDDYARKRMQAVMIASVYGGCPIKVHWDFRSTSRMVRVNQSEMVEMPVVERDQPTMTLVDPYSFYYDPKATSMDDCRYVFHRMRIHRDDLKRKVRADGSPLYKNLEKIDEWLKALDQENSTERDARGRPTDRALAERERTRRRGVEIIEMWTRDRLIVIAADRWVIRDEPNPFLHGRIPFEVAVTQHSLNDMWGISEMWAIKDTQDHLHTIRNAQLDALSLSINPPLAVDVTDDLGNAQRDLSPGARFPARMPARDIISPMNVTGIDHLASEEAIRNLHEEMQFITGITRELAGLGDSSSATEAAINQRAAKGRISLKLRTVDEAFARCAEMFIQLDQQYLNFAKQVRVNGEQGLEWVTLTPYEIAGLWDIRTTNSSERVLKELQRENATRALEVALPLFSPDFVTPEGMVVDPTPLIEKYLEAFDIDPSTVMRPVEQQQEQQVQQAEVDGIAEANTLAQLGVPPPLPELEAGGVNPFVEGQGAFGAATAEG